MIVDYDKETDIVHIAKKINNQWMQIGLNRDEVNQIVRSNPYNPQAEREKVLDKLLERFDDDTRYNGWYVRQTIQEILRQGGE